MYVYPFSSQIYKMNIYNVYHFSSQIYKINPYTHTKHREREIWEEFWHVHLLMTELDHHWPCSVDKYVKIQGLFRGYSDVKKEEEKDDGLRAVKYFF